MVEEDPGAKVGPGIRQQWEMSCGPTTVQLLHGQTDPIYALKLTGGGDITQVGKHAEAKKEQGKLLKGHGSTPTELGTAGTGAWVEADYNALKDGDRRDVQVDAGEGGRPDQPGRRRRGQGAREDQGLARRSSIYIPIVIGGKPERHRALQRDPALRREAGASSSTTRARATRAG